MNSKEKLIEILIEISRAEKLTMLLFFLTVLSIILDASTTIYALKIGLNEDTRLFHYWMDIIGVIPALILFNVINLFIITSIYIFIKKIFPNIVSSLTKFWNSVCLFILDIMLIIFLLWICLNSSSTVLSNLVNIIYKIKILGAT